MDLFDTLEADLLEATKTRDEIRTGVLRLLKSALKNQQIEVGHDLSLPEILAVLQKEAKKRRDSIAAYQKAGRTDLVEEEQQELDIIDTYLPAQATDEEVAKVVDEVIKATSASDMSAMGAVMGQAMAKLQGRADGNQVSAVVRDKLK